MVCHWTDIRPQKKFRCFVSRGIFRVKVSRAPCQRVPLAGLVVVEANNQMLGAGFADGQLGFTAFR